LGGLDPRKAHAIVVISQELARFSQGSDLIGRQLRAGVAAATDAVFLADLIAATTPIPNAGATAANTGARLVRCRKFRLVHQQRPQGRWRRFSGLGRLAVHRAITRDLL